IFPIHIFKVKEGVNFNEGDPNYDLFKLAMRVSAKRMFPNFSFIDAPFNLQYYKEGDYHTEIAYMGCRTRVIGNNHDKSREIVTGRGNLSFTTINLPRLGIEAHGDLDKFYKSLDRTMDIVFDQLYQRLLIQSRKHVRNYPFLMGQGVWIDSEKLSENDSVAEVLKHGSLSTGFIGLAETLVALTGKHHGESEESQKLGLEIITHMRERADAKSRETGLNFTLLATPAEGLSGRFIAIDKKRYGEIPGITDKDFYTNSFHVPVYYNISAFKKIKLEAPYHALTNGGHISYVELDGDPQKNLDAFEKIVRYMKEQGIGYGAINHPIDRDPCCGFTGIIDDECPNCRRREGETIEDRIERPKRFTADN
ncbi:MAG: anaerobic ribonucleoside-triphosphate reductase, partial [Oscillospiraceae bacterium]